MEATTSDPLSSEFSRRDSGDRDAAHDFYRSVKSVLRKVECLCLSLDWSLGRLAPLDSCSRHDQPIDDDRWRALANSHPQSTLYMQVLSDLGASKTALENAGRRVQGKLRGEAKNKVEGLMARQLATAQHLFELFQELTEVQLETSRLPYQIRQADLGSLAGAAAQVADALVGLYRNADKRTIDHDLLQSVLREQQSALQVRSVLNRLRDNPSQKVADKLKDCSTKMTGVRRGLFGVARDVATRGELRFVTRGGQIIDFSQTFLAHEYRHNDA